MINFPFLVGTTPSEAGSLKENKTLVSIQPANGSFSAIVGLSQFRFLGIMITDKTIRTEEIVKFLASLKSKLREE